MKEIATKTHEKSPEGYRESRTPLTESSAVESSEKQHKYQTRLFNGKVVRVQKDEDGEPWLVAVDLCALLEYQNGPAAIATHCKGEVKKARFDTEGGSQFLQIICEADVYRLIMQSKMPQAVEFQDWVVQELLPSIRKTAHYKVTRKLNYVPQTTNDTTPPGEQLDLFPRLISFALPEKPVTLLREARARLASEGTTFESHKDFLGYVIEKGLEAL